MEELKMGFYTTEKHGENVPRVGRIVGTIAVGILGLVGTFTGVRTVDAGYVGVKSLFGRVDPVELESGLHFTKPFGFERVTQMTTRTREVKEPLKVPTSEGLTVEKLDVSVLYHVQKDKADEVYVKLGDDGQYEENVVRPLVRSVVRDVVSGFKSEDLYNQAKRGEIAAEIHQRLSGEMEERGLVLEDILIRDLQLPKELEDAITAKLKAQQETLRMDFEIEKEKKEAEKRTTQAQGIADAQRIISQSLDQNYLTWNYIENLEKIVSGNNATIVVLPFDQKLIPMLPIPTGKKEGAN